MKRNTILTVIIIIAVAFVLGCIIPPIVLKAIFL